MSFDELYKKADATLYSVKGAGRDNFAFYDDDIGQHSGAKEPSAADARRRNAMKYLMLIVEDNKIDSEMLAFIFRNDFKIERARDGKTALMLMRHYGSAISVVLLDLIMPGMDGFAVLEEMSKRPDISSIPTIVVSGDDKRETGLRAIRAGAADFVMKPVDPDIIRVRVQSAISKAENARLRAQNSLLSMQGGETARYKAVLNKLGLIVIEMDWGKGTFAYDPSISQYIAGSYDSRTLWHILLCDMVTDVRTVKSIQKLVHDTANDRGRTEGSIFVRLKTPSGAKRRFRINAYKLANEFGLTDKMIRYGCRARPRGSRYDTRAIRVHVHAY